MTTDSTVYAARIRHTELFSRAEDNSSVLKLYSAGSQVIPTSGSVTLKKPDGLYIVQDAPCTITAEGTIQYTFSAAQLPITLALGEGYLL